MALLVVVFFFLLASSTTSTTTELTVPFNKSYYSSIVCSGLTFQDPSTSTTLDIFFTALVAQSNSAKFYHTFFVNGTTSVDGHYKCRANLSQTECQTCVKKITSIIPKPCKTATAELVDCNMKYDVDQSKDISSGLTSDGREDYGGCIGAFMASVVATVVSILLQS